MESFLSASWLTPSEWYAIGIPVVLCALCALSGATRKFNTRLALLFFVGTLESVLFSSWEHDEDKTLLHIFPACAFLLVLAPKALRPSGMLAYCMLFFSLLLTDVLQTILYANHVQCASLDFFCGIGGGGMLDSLFLVPLMGAVIVEALSWAERSGLGKVVLFKAPPGPFGRQLAR